MALLRMILVLLLYLLMTSLLGLILNRLLLRLMLVQHFQTSISSSNFAPKLNLVIKAIPLNLGQLLDNAIVSFLPKIFKHFDLVIGQQSVNYDTYLFSIF